jgi:hypothetical protein
LVLVETATKVGIMKAKVVEMAFPVLIQFFPQLHLLVAVVAVATTAAVVEVVLVEVEPLVVLEQPTKVLTAVAVATLVVVEVREHWALVVQGLEAVALVELAYQTI